uniref:FBA_2 domain-containing protein n=1 Tax=Steinernema glaseri TaxID=37863 RepID=A0A1I7YI16_9BILA
MSRQDASALQSSMASVPFAFRESVCATLGVDSLWTVRFLPDTSSWSSVAEKVKTETKRFELRMKMDGAEVFYNASVTIESPEGVPLQTLMSLEEAKEAKYLRCSRLENYLGNPDENTNWKVTLRTLFSVVQIEGLDLSRTDLRSVNDYCSHINPWYLRVVDIHQCKFTSALPLCTWVKKVLASKCLCSLGIKYNTFAKAMKSKLDLNEEVYDALVHHKGLRDIAIHENDSIKDLGIPFFKRVLDFWVASENGFQRKLILHGSAKRKQLKKKENTMYNFRKDLFTHASDRETVEISNYYKDFSQRTS